MNDNNDLSVPEASIQASVSGSGPRLWFAVLDYLLIYKNNQE